MSAIDTAVAAIHAEYERARIAGIAAQAAAPDTAARATAADAAVRVAYGAALACNAARRRPARTARTARKHLALRDAYAAACKAADVACDAASAIYRAAYRAAEGARDAALAALAAGRAAYRTLTPRRSTLGELSRLDAAIIAAVADAPPNDAWAAGLTVRVAIGEALAAYVATRTTRGAMSDIATITAASVAEGGAP